MKHLRTLSILIFSLLALMCSAQKTLSEVSAIKGVTSVYVGKAMIKKASMANFNYASGVMDMSKLADKLTSIEVLQCDSKRTVSEALPVANRILGEYPFEVLSEVKDDDSVVEVSGVFDDDGETINMLLIKVAEDDDELTLILLKGAIDIATLQTALR